VIPRQSATWRTLLDCHCAEAQAWRTLFRMSSWSEAMSKERKSTREAKKKPTKTLTEKRAAKKAKKDARGFPMQ